LTEAASAANNDGRVPRRGDVWLAAFGAGRPDEPGKNRPAVVVSVDDVVASTDGELIVVVPTSSSRAGSSLQPPIVPAEGVDAPSVALCPAVRAVSRRRLLRPLGRANTETLAAIERSLAMLLALD
jgi:mRNA interferase MazF